MAVWDLNSNLDVFSMQTFLRGLIYRSPEPLVCGYYRHHNAMVRYGIDSMSPINMKAKTYYNLMTT